MKILFVQDSLGTGGAERSNADLWYFLKAQGVTIKIVVLEHRKEGVEKEVLNSGFDVTFLDPGNFLKKVKDIARIIRIHKPDIVHSVLFRSTFPVRAVRHFIPFCHLVSLVSCPYSKERLKDTNVNKLGVKFYKMLDRITHIRGTDGFIAITEETKKHHEKHVKIPSSKIVVIKRGRKENPFIKIQHSVRSDLIKELGLLPSDLIFVHVGRQEYAKGHLTFFKAIKQADEELLRNRVHFVFCGRKGNATKEIDNYLISANIKSKITFLGHRDDVYKILAGSDVFVFPSLFEGLGGSLIEAQAAALPVICSDIKVFYEVVKNKSNALMFAPGNTKDLAEKLKLLAISEDLRKEMSENSLINFNKNFSIQEVHEKMLKYFMDWKLKFG